MLFKAKEFEAACVFALAGAEAEGLATMSRYGVQCVLRDDKWQPIKSLPDFEGVLRGGRQFIFDAKVCSQASLKLDDGHFQERQLRHLRRRAWFGAITFLLVHFNPRELKTKRVPPWTVAVPVAPFHDFWRQVEAGEAKTLTRQDCAHHGVPVAWSPPGPRQRTPRMDLCGTIDAVAAALEEQRRKNRD